MDETKLKERILELEHAVRVLNQLWTEEYKSHYKTQLRVIELQKRILGIKDE